MTKEDYMHLPKERLAEMLAERDMAVAPISIPTPVYPVHFDYCPLCGGLCTNPFHDCINCPRHAIGFNTQSGTSTASLKNERNE